MTALLLALASFGGLLAYSTVAVALYKWRTRGTIGSYDPLTWEHVGLALAILSIYGSVLATLLLTTHAAAHQSASTVAVAWAILAGIAALVGTGTTFGCRTPETLLAVRAAFWPLAYPLGWLARGIVGAVVVGARGPLKAGDWLATVPRRRELRQAEVEKARAEREARIAELEKELEL
jgi:hypothetical protein